ncbi:hypothetical protein AGLY_005186 [Aphis glycines]|uniref:Uncharacterized protein n=1 Tax=Aphis glycines TaxID=307491 RepID=A0A6G0TWE6_APHGL|nr:hypothetical protein AGLY_005186 [Aphis glycines]
MIKKEDGQVSYPLLYNMFPNKSGTKTFKTVSLPIVKQSPMTHLRIIKCIHTCMRLIDTINSPIPNKLRENLTAIELCNRLNFLRTNFVPSSPKFKVWRGVGDKLIIFFENIREQQAAFAFITSFIISSYMKKRRIVDISMVHIKPDEYRFSNPYSINFAPNIRIKALNNFGFRFIEDALANSDLHILIVFVCRLSTRFWSPPQYCVMLFGVA